MSSSTEWAAGGGGQAAPPDLMPGSPADPADPAAEPARAEPDRSRSAHGDSDRSQPEHGELESRGERGPRDVPWFLPAGRAGLAPESVTIDAAALDETSVDLQAVVDIAGAPPWAAEPANAEPEAPPPWESGPWPSRRQAGAEYDLPDHGITEHPLPEHALPPSRRADSRPAEPGDWPANGRQPGYDYSAGGSAPAQQAAGRRPGAAPAEPGSNTLAMAALIAGIAGILVVPGIVLGILGLRRARVSGIGQVQSLLGIGLSLVWAVGIILTVVSLSGQNTSADSGCPAYQAGGRAAVAKVTAALAAGAPARKVRADLSAAAGSVNSAAAQAQDVAVQSRLSVLTGDLQQGLREVGPRHAAPAGLGATLSADSAALGQVCG
jgi:hypothetical protein